VGNPSALNCVQALIDVNCIWWKERWRLSRIAQEITDNSHDCIHALEICVFLSHNLRFSRPSNKLAIVFSTHTSFVPAALCLTYDNLLCFSVWKYYVNYIIFLCACSPNEHCPCLRFPTAANIWALRALSVCDIMLRILNSIVWNRI
jgi:hypothetical protein